jgi:hypothetical protein
MKRQSDTKMEDQLHRTAKKTPVISASDYKIKELQLLDLCKKVSGDANIHPVHLSELRFVL